MSAKRDLRELVDRLGEERANELLPYLRQLLGKGGLGEPHAVVEYTTQRKGIPATERERGEEADRLYERYGKSLEAEHWGAYVAISPRGEVMLGPTVLDVMRRAKEAFGPGNYISKVGERVVGGWGRPVAPPQG